MEKKVAKIIFLDFDGVLNTEYHQRKFCLKLLF
jgi:histidinol phosphatase-like enzyme